MLDFHNDIHIFPSQIEVGNAAGKAIETCIVNLQKCKETISIVFAAAPSQNSMLNYLSSSSLIDWDKIRAFHMDEYLGLPNQAPQLFSTYLEHNLFSKVGIKEKHIIKVESKIDEEIERYSRLIDEGPIDIVCLGIGENGHIAFNDPPVAKFEDPKTMKVVLLDEKCRLQQVNDGCFSLLSDVPKAAVTLTVPTLLRGGNLFCMVLGAQKSNAVKQALAGPVSTDCPASILTTHTNCKYYFDEAAYQDMASFQFDTLNE